MKASMSAERQLHGRFPLAISQPEHRSFRAGRSPLVFGVRAAEFFRRSGCGVRICFALALTATVSLRAATWDAPPDNSPAQLYNEGTRKLRDGKWREAEASLQTALASQDSRVRVPALYNLGQARFQQGVQELKNGPDANATTARTDHSSALADQALQAADDALAANHVEALVAAYRRGRGARRDLKGALEAVKRAVESYGTVLNKWQRAWGDFTSAHELQAADRDAQFNAEVMDRHIARLVDTQQLMLQGQQCLSKKRQQLKDKMGQLKEKMPKEKQQQCNSEDAEDEDEDGEKQPPKEPPKGHEEPKPRDGKEVALTPEEAARLLELLKLDANRKLPLGVQDTGQPKDRKRRNW